MGWVCSRIWYIRRKYRLWCQKYKFGNLSKHLIRPSTGVYLLAAEMEVPYSKWSVFLGVLIPRRPWLTWNWRAQTFTTVGCHGVKPPPPLIEVLFTLLQWFYPCFQDLLLNYDTRTGVLFSIPGKWSSTNPSFGPFHSAVRVFLVSASLSACF